MKVPIAEENKEVRDISFCNWGQNGCLKMGEKIKFTDEKDEEILRGLKMVEGHFALRLIEMTRSQKKKSQDLAQFPLLRFAG